MKTILRSLALTGVVAVGSLGLGATEARAQAFGFNYASPGFSFGVGNGGYGGYYGGGYPLVAPAPVVVAPAPLVVAPRPVFLPPRPYYYGGYYGGYRPYYPRGGYYRR
ncbi:MAG: hypothetical protein P4L84_02895 [Isosphaeraceae bacterium]|nr:hypothetical protein [Isosphaeraceae bacterium]